MGYGAISGDFPSLSNVDWRTWHPLRADQAGRSKVLHGATCSSAARVRPHARPREVAAKRMLGGARRRPAGKMAAFQERGTGRARWPLRTSRRPIFYSGWKILRLAHSQNASQRCVATIRNVSQCVAPTFEEPMSEKRQHQVSVPLDPELREFAARSAAQQDRTVAAWIRHLVAEAARRQHAEERTAS
jgi:hypothetical protein